MAFGMKSAASAGGDFPPIMKFNSQAGRVFTVDYSWDTRERLETDITSPPPRFAIDFGSALIGWMYFGANGPEHKLVPIDTQPPPQPADRDEKGKLKYREGCQLKVFGRVLGGSREWSSTANCVNLQIEDLYTKFRAAPEAATGKVPIVEISKVIPVQYGKGANLRTLYAPGLRIVGWTDRKAEWGPRIVPPPTPPTKTDGAAAAVNMGGHAVPLPKGAPLQAHDDLDDEIPF